MRARLKVESGEAHPREWSLKGAEGVKIGRQRDNTIVLRDKHASRQHAEIFRENGHWLLRDCDTTNGTRLDGQRIKAPVLLENGCEIRIGDTCLRFSLEPSESPTEEMEALPPVPDFASPAPAVPTPQPEELSVCPTDLEPDELTALLIFMNASLRETTPAGVVGLALQTAHKQTRAAISGFLSLDPDAPLPRMVLPALEKVDIHLSRELTQRVQRAGKTAWLAGDSAESSVNMESLMSYRDAVCVPVRDGETALGALHVYKVGEAFAPRQVRFCEALGGYLARCLHVLRARRALEADNSRLREHVPAYDPDLIGSSPPMKQLRQQIRKLADGPRILLVCGESGTGKELVALALHRQSPRREEPLVVVNCAAIPATLCESQLFGHKKGSFSGADRDHTGYFAQADLGTLFLDEIGELPEDCQAKLLRVLETGIFRPIGAPADEQADVRVVVATNRDLKRECLEERFRKDLFFRLGVGISVPPLREHKEDIPDLVAHFLKRLAGEYRRTVRVSDDAMERLREYRWPGNVRQLRSVLEHAVAMSDGPVIGAGDLHLLSGELSPSPAGPSLNLEELERWAIRQALARAQGTVVQAARILGIHRDTLMAKMKKYEIERDA